MKLKHPENMKAIGAVFATKSTIFLRMPGSRQNSLRNQHDSLLWTAVSRFTMYLLGGASRTCCVCGDNSIGTQRNSTDCRVTKWRVNGEFSCRRFCAADFSEFYQVCGSLFASGTLERVWMCILYSFMHGKCKLTFEHISS
jgi:hypothetical protein